MAGDYSNTSDLQSDLAILEARMPQEWPNKATLRPYLKKLLENPGSLVFVAIEAPRGPNGPTVGKGWFSCAEREVLRKALQKVNERRKKNGEKPTTESP